MSSTTNSAAIPVRPLGRNGPLVPRLGLGLVNLGGGVYGEKLSDEERFAFLDAAYEKGERFWDTADEYRDGETFLAKWFAANPEKRKNVFLATKFGIQGADKIKGEGFAGITIDSSPEYCKAAIERSLTRLGLDYVDLYYVHRLDKKTPIEKTVQAMHELQKAGKIKYIGLSECSAESIRRASTVCQISCVQVEYSVFVRAIEDPQIKVLETARELEIATVAYSPLGLGVLTGTIRGRSDVLKPGDKRGMIPWLKDDNAAKNVATVDKLSDLAKARNLTAAQLSLAWLLAQGDDIFPIPSTTNVRRLEENLGALQAEILSEDDAAIREIAKDVAGQRVQDLTGWTFADTPPLEG